MARTAPADLGREPRSDTEVAPDQQPAAPSQRSARLRDALRLLLVGLLMAALGYGGGRLHAWSHAEREARERDAQMAAQQADVLRAKEEQEQALVRAQALTERALRQRDQLALVAGLYEGYRRVQHALNALDARNFGIAEARVRDAERQLAPLASQVAGLPAILEQLAGTRIAVAGNLGEQRRGLATIASSLDGALTEQRVASNIEELQGATRKDDAQAPPAGAAAPAAQGSAETRSAPEPIVPAPQQAAPEVPNEAPTQPAPAAGEAAGSAR